MQEEELEPMASLAACLIVKDEAAVLPACLRSLQGVVDEVVVGDTGSQDGSQELAGQLGARVVALDWQDDFAAARNDALTACASDWVLSIDADEIASVSGRLREWLSSVPEAIDALSVEIGLEETLGQSGLQRHREAKLFRLSRLRWSGRVHERLVRGDGTAPELAPVDPLLVHLVHRGYRDQSAVRAKAARNARLAQLEFAELRARGAKDAELLRVRFELARSQFGAGLDDAAEEAFSAIRLEAGSGPYWLWSGDFLARLALRSGQPERALELIEELERAAPAASYLAWLRAVALVAAGRLGEARTALEGLDAVTDLSGRPLGPGALDQLRRFLANPGSADPPADERPRS